MIRVLSIHNIIRYSQKKMTENIFCIGPIFDDRLKENSRNPERVPSVVTFVYVCLSVRPSVRPLAGYRSHLLT